MNPAGARQTGRAGPGGRSRVPELRIRGRRWLSFSCEEAISILEDMLQRGEDGLDLIRLRFEGTHRAPLPDIPEEEDAILPLPGSGLLPGQEITLRIRRPGIYDRLPAVLFCDPADYVNRRGNPEVATRLDEDEAHARLLFQPFDREGAFVRSRIRTWRAVFSGARPNDSYRDFVCRLFGLSASCRCQMRQLLSEEQQNILIFLVPHLSQITGHAGRVRDVLQLLLPDPVRLRFGVNLAYELPEEAKSYLDPGVRLDEQAVGDLITTGEKVLVLEVGPVPSERLLRYRCPEFTSSPTGPFFDLGTVGEGEEQAERWGDLALTVRFLCSLLVPVDLRVVLQPRPLVSDWFLEKEAAGRCGLDTFAVA